MFTEEQEDFLLKTDKKDVGKRLDKFVMDNLEDVSRNKIKKLIEKEEVLVNEKKAKAGYKLKQGDEVKIENVALEDDFEVLDKYIEPEPINLSIIYEDEDLLVINKPKGMVTHPAPGNVNGTLVNALLYHYKELSNLGGKIRPGIVHRLDKDTSGVMLIAKNDQIHNYLKDEFKHRRIIKEYLAISEGRFTNSKRIIEAPIGRHPENRKRMDVVEGGRDAKTHVKVLRTFEFKDNYYNYIKAFPVTGRTHQIRVHLSYLGCPIIGDEVYGKGKKKKGKTPHFNINGQALHAFKLKFYHPRKKKELIFKAPLPEYFSDLLRWFIRFYK